MPAVMGYWGRCPGGGANVRSMHATTASNRGRRADHTVALDYRSSSRPANSSHTTPKSPAILTVSVSRKTLFDTLPRRDRYADSPITAVN